MTMASRNIIVYFVSAFAINFNINSPFLSFQKTVSDKITQRAIKDEQSMVSL